MTRPEGFDGPVQPGITMTLTIWEWRRIRASLVATGQVELATMVDPDRVVATRQRLRPEPAWRSHDELGRVTLEPVDDEGAPDGR